MTSSRLVETIQINFEDFSESFLTCSTCLTLFDSSDHQPKLLPCSHTLCRSCLQRIMQGPMPGSNRQPDSFRCPICREGIAVPLGGAAAFPASFVVNQLLDLMASQRREVVPKCSVHASKELLFCETCDCVFCPACPDVSHRANADHTVLSFSVAVKRMSEILLYKAHLATNQLASAYDVVCREADRLEQNTEACLRDVDVSFDELRDIVDRRHAEVRESVLALQQQKAKVLKEQQDLISCEKAKVEAECDGLQRQMDVMAITKTIADLNAKLDTFSVLSEPRENSYMRFCHKESGIFNEIDTSIRAFGCVRVSTTYPALCSVSCPAATVNLRCTAAVRTVDYNGCARTSGGDPVAASLESPMGEMLQVGIKDAGDGTYRLHFVPLGAGPHLLHVRIFDRHVRDSPLQLQVSGRQRPAARAGGGRGHLPGQLQAPFAVAVGRNAEVFVSDTGNCRIAMLDSSLRWLGHFGQAACEGQAATGLAVDAGGRVWVANWKLRRVCELDPLEDRIVTTVCSDAFKEPGLVAVGSRGEVVVGDAGAGSVFLCDPSGGVLSQFGAGRFTGLTAIAATAAGHLLLAQGPSIRVSDCAGRQLGAMTAAGGAVTGLAVDADGRLLVARPSGVEVYARPLGSFVCRVEPEETDALRRPAGVCCLPSGCLVVADVAAHSVKKFRYT